MRIPRTFLLLAALTVASQAVDGWVVRPDGVGPVRIGMGLIQLNAALHERFAMPAEKSDQGCFYVHPKSHPQIALMIEDGKLVRVDVDKPGISTEEGVQVGDSQVHAQHVYGVKAKVEPSQYTGEEGGRYLTIRSPDGHSGIRFETEKGKITTFYAGTYAAIQYVEGCE
jgi:hypothetical protein